MLYLRWVLLQMLYIVASITVWNFKENRGTKLEKMAKKPSFGPDFGPFVQIWPPNMFSSILPLLDVRHYYKLSLYAISSKNNEPVLRKQQKT